MILPEYFDIAVPKGTNLSVQVAILKELGNYTQTSKYVANEFCAIYNPNMESKTTASYPLNLALVECGYVEKISAAIIDVTTFGAGNVFSDALFFSSSVCYVLKDL